MVWNPDALVQILGSCALCAAAAAVSRYLRANTKSGTVALLQFSIGALVSGAWIADFLPESVGAGTVCIALLASGILGFFLSPSYRSTQIRKLVDQRVVETTHDAEELMRQADRMAEAQRALNRRDHNGFEHAIANIEDLDQSGDDLDDSFRPLLHEASLKGIPDFVLSLLAAGSNPNRVDGFRGSVTALHLAAQSGSVSSVIALLKAGADINAQNQWGSTALWYAATCHDGHPSVVRKLLEYGADPDIADAEGRTPLDWATMSTASARKLEVVSALSQVAKRAGQSSSQQVRPATRIKLSPARVDEIISKYEWVLETGVTHWHRGQLYPVSLLPGSIPEVESAIFQLARNLSTSQRLSDDARGTLRFSYATLAQFVEDSDAIRARALSYAMESGRTEAVVADNGESAGRRSEAVAEFARRMNSFDDELARVTK